MREYEFHPFCLLFAQVEKPDLRALADDIRRNGLRNKIVLFQNKILDGKNRFLACKMAKIEPDFVEFHGSDEEALELVRSLNLHRRMESLTNKVKLFLQIQMRLQATAKAKTAPAPPPSSPSPPPKATTPQTVQEQVEAVRQAESAPRRSRIDEEKTKPKLERSIVKFLSQFQDCHGRDELALIACQNAVTRVWHAMVTGGKKFRQDCSETVRKILEASQN